MQKGADLGVNFILNTTYFSSTFLKQTVLYIKTTHFKVCAKSAGLQLISVSKHHESDLYLSQLRALGTHSPSLMFYSPHMGGIFLLQTWECRFFSDLDIGVRIF